MAVTHCNVFEWESQFYEHVVQDKKPKRVHCDVKVRVVQCKIKRFISISMSCA